jgi:DNA-binding transcriptional LysR family regulator
MLCPGFRDIAKVDRLASMRAFVKVVEAGSFVRGADKLGISTTTASRLVAELEEHLGTRLLQRTTRKLHLTDAGQRYFDRALQLLSDLEEAESEVGSATTTPRGRLRISVGQTFGVRQLSALFPRFQAMYPEVELEVFATDRRVDLIEEGFDLAVRMSLELPPAYVARHLCVIRVVVCASPAYLKQNGTPKTPQDLLAHNCLTVTSGGFENRWLFEGADGSQTVQVHGNYRSDSGDLLRGAALAGQGIVYLPTFIVGEELARGELVPILRKWQLPQIDAKVVYPSRRFVSAKVRAFTEFLQREFAGEPEWDRWMQET